MNLAANLTISQALLVVAVTLFLIVCIIRVSPVFCYAAADAALLVFGNFSFAHARPPDSHYFNFACLTISVIIKRHQFKQSIAINKATVINKPVNQLTKQNHPGFCFVNRSKLTGQVSLTFLLAVVGLGNRNFNFVGFRDFFSHLNGDMF